MELPGMCSHSDSNIRPSLSDCIADEELARAIQDQAEPVQVPPGYVLFRQGQASRDVFYVVEGEVEATMEASGRVVMCASLGHGSLLGLPAVVGERPYSLRAEMKTYGRICKVIGEEFLTRVSRNPKYSLNVLRILASEIRSAREAMERLLPL